MITNYTPEITEFSIINFSIIGRALCIATYFDKICKSFLTALIIKSPSYFIKNIKKFKNINLKLNDTELYDQIIEISEKLTLNQCIKILSEINLEIFTTTGTLEKFNKAKESRNFFAHELCLGYPENINNSKYRKELINQTKENILIIADCLIQMETWISIYNNEEIDPSISKANLIGRIASWTIDDEIF